MIHVTSLDDLRERLAGAHVRGEKAADINLARLDRVLAHVPEDMTVTVEAGVPLARLQSELSRHCQWLPLDPPNPDRLTVGALIAKNASGPRRFAYGTVQNYLIGLKVILADGRLIHSGGRVVKNVAGYDLAKLFIGSHGSLGVIVEATFKLRPLPEAEQFLQLRGASWDQAGAWIEAILDSDIRPVALDLHNLSPPEGRRSHAVMAVLGVAGTREDVDWQLAIANQLGWKETATLDYERLFWQGETAPARTSVLPSRLVETLRGLGDVPLIARAANGVIYHLGGPQPASQEAPTKLIRRVKDAFDPNHILPECRM